ARLAEVDLVQVHLEDLLLRRAALEHEREQGLLRLALEAALGRPVAALVGRPQEEVLAELLRDRARALRAGVAFQVVDHGASEPDRIEPGVAEEAAVLDRE